MSYPPTPQRKACDCSDPCISTDDVYYAGPNLPNSGINTNNLLTVVIEKLDAIYAIPTLQRVTEMGNYTTLPIIADSFVKIGGDGTNILLDDGTVLPIGDLPIPPAPGLQQVLDVDTYAEVDGGDSYADILGGNPNNRWHDFTISNGLSGIDYQSTSIVSDSDNASLISVNGNETARIKATGGNVELHRQANEIGKKTVVTFTRPTQDTTLDFPAKSVAGTYTIATLDDIIAPALVFLDEGNGNGIVRADRDPAHFGNIGLDALDLSTWDPDAPNTGDYGAMAEASFVLGYANKAISGYGTFINGSLCSSNEDYLSFISGFYHTQTGLTYSNSLMGQLHSITGGANATIVGQCANVVTNDPTDVNNGGNTMFAVGNGRAQGDGTLQSRSTAFQVYKDGRIIAPTLTTTLITAEATGKILVTKEYLTSVISGGTVTSIGVSSPLVSSTGGAITSSGTISLPQATTSVSGYLTSTDWNTFNGKANVNSQTFTGTPSLPTGTIGVTQTAGTNNTTLATTAFATTALNGKMNNPSLTASYIPKALTATTIGNSRIVDTDTYLGIGTVNTPTKDITLGNQANREIGIEESTNIVVGRDLAINAGRTVNYVPSTGFIRLNLLKVQYYGADSLSNGDILITGNGNIVYKLVSGSPPFVNYGIAPGGGRISIHPTNDNIIYATGNGTNVPIYISTNGGVSFSAISGITSRNYIYVKIMPNGDAYATVSGSNDIYKRTGGTGDFIAMGFTARSYTYIISTPSGDAYFPVEGDDIYKINSGTSVLTALGQTFRSWANGYFLNGDLYIAVGGTSYKQTGLAGNFVLNTLFTYPVNPIGVLWNVTVSKTTNNVYVPAYDSDVWVQYNNGEGTSNLSGGTLKLNSGTGKGTGASDIEMWTGQVLTSGTTMQTATLRAKIDNTGLMTLPSVTNALIEADTTGKAVVTKEYVNNRLVVETTSGYTLTNTDSGGIVIFKTTAAQTLTIPTGLADGFECTFVTLSGVTLTVVSTGNTLNNATSTTMLPQLSFTLKRMLATNTYIATGNL